MATSKGDILLAEARKAYQTGDRARMRDLIKQAVTADPNNIDAWLLATYATDNPAQQRQFIDRAKQIKRVDTRILMREKELFPDIDNGFSFVPDESPSALPPQTTPSAPVQPDPMAPGTQRQPQPPTDHIPTLADGVRLKPANRLNLPLLALIPVGIGALIILLLAFFQSRPPDTPSSVVLRFYPALEAGDNATLGTLLSDDARALCGDNLVQCLGGRPRQFQGFSIASETLSGQTATVRLRIQMTGGQQDLCQDFLVVDTNQGWKIEKDVGQMATCSSQAASLPSQVAPSNGGAQTTVTLDPTQAAVLQTATLLGQTQSAMLLAPTLTATYLAPGQTQTALVVEQDRLNTALAATQTQAVVMVSQTAVVVGLTTSTPVAQTQVAATATQAAAVYKSSLTGKLVAAQNIQGKTQIVTLNADGSSLTNLNVVGIDPTWSPDGQRIGYSNREHQEGIHIMAADGSGDTELPIQGAPFGSAWVTWSRDNRLLFDGGTRLGLHAEFISNPDGSNAKQWLDDSHAGGWTSWAPDGKQAVYVKDDQVWVIKLDGSAPHSIATQAGARAPVWSPDGQRIAFDAGDDHDRGLYLMNADGSGLARITSKSAYVGLPAWSPDGKHLAALCYDGRTGSNRICVLDVNGANLTAITDSGFDGRIAWKP